MNLTLSLTAVMLALKLIDQDMPWPYVAMPAIVYMVFFIICFIIGIFKLHK